MPRTFNRIVSTELSSPARSLNSRRKSSTGDKKAPAVSAAMAQTARDSSTAVSFRSFPKLRHRITPTTTSAAA